ncbi:S41 family peptidase [Pontixanthobacter gangjinensis]
MFSKTEVIQDLDYLYKALKESHYNLFAYTPEAQYDDVHNHLKTSINKDSLSLLEATTILQQLTSSAQNGHTEIGFPGQSYIEFASAGGKLFPLELAIEGDRTLVRKNWSNQTISPGTQVVAIDDVPIQEILTKIYPQISAERTYFKNAKLEMFSFPRYYWQVFGEKDNFKIEVLSNGERKTLNLSAIEAIEDYEMKREEILSSKMELRFLGSTAFLNPGNFGGDTEIYQSFIDSSFTRIQEAEIENLIIDLRNNAGGDDSFSDYLVSYIADRPFLWTSNFSLKSSQLLKDQVRKERDTTQPFWREVLVHKNDEIYPYKFEAFKPQPEAKRFKGDVFVLINRQSHSQSAVTAAQIQDYDFGTIVGEETGDYPSLYASVFYFQLPNTGTTVQVSKGRIIRVNGSTAEEGVIPDIFIKDYLLDENDEILNGLLQKLQNE